MNTNSCNSYADATTTAIKNPVELEELFDSMREPHL